MKTLFSNKCTMLLIRGGITLLTVSVMVSIFISPLGTYAHKSSTQPVLGTTKSAFSDFCYASWTSGLHSEDIKGISFCPPCGLTNSQVITLLLPHLHPYLPPTSLLAVLVTLRASKTLKYGL